MYIHHLKRALLGAVVLCTLAATGNLAPAAGAHAVAMSTGQLTPAQTLIGQRAAVCYGVYRFDVQVQDADWQRTIACHAARGNAQWVVALASVTNLGTETGIVAETAVLRDERGRVFSPSSAAGVTGDIAGAYGVKAPYDFYEPGITETVALAFEVAPDAQQLTLASSNFQCQS